ncbi:nitroreductase [Candidatus Woesearchaeota archaeon CG10_big_fil_rev_8_21_14_0_10_34_8]|nr:MAG: nitroreductase [Candidatus Woesearchaeota archaeon CG10_big_fil_rev_8_21_14_0_10_34_8]
MDVLHCIKTRRSVRKYQDIPIPFEYVGRVIEAGFNAPTAGNIQDVRFIIVQDKAKREKIAEACLQQFWMSAAPVQIVVCVDIKRGKQFYGIRGERLYSVEHAAAAAQNMLLAAHSYGLGACWIGAFDEEALKSICGIPPYARPQMVITLGYADEIPPRPPKYIIETYTYIERFNNRIRTFPLVIAEPSPVIEKHVRDTLGAIDKGTNTLLEKGVKKGKEVWKKLTK